LANFVKPASRGLPLCVPPLTADRVHPGAAAGAAVSTAGSGLNTDILPLSMVAVPGPLAGAAAITSIPVPVCPIPVCHGPARERS
jgi:hypothetical protein